MVTLWLFIHLEEHSAVDGVNSYLLRKIKIYQYEYQHFWFDSSLTITEIFEIRESNLF